jgi:hypothetical protein
LIKTSQNGSNYIVSHSKFVIETHDVIQDDKYLWRIYFLKTLTVWYLAAFEWLKFDHIFISPYELQFLFVFQFFCPKSIYMGHKVHMNNDPCFLMLYMGHFQIKKWNQLH